MKRNRKPKSAEQNKIDASFLHKSELPITPSQEDSLKYELEILLQEYQMTTTQIVHRSEADEKGLELSLLVVSTVITAATFAVQYTAYTLLLVLAIPFHVLIWGQVRRVNTSRRLVEYVTRIVAPRLNTIIGRTSYVDGKPIEFVSWEGYISNNIRTDFFSYLAVLLTQAGRVLVQLSAAIILPIAYMLFRQGNPQYQISPFDTPLLIMNILFLSLSLFLLSITFIQTRKHLSQ
jgi:hypothetical protein